MKMIFKAFFKHLFGAAYERLARTLFVYLIVFWGLHIAGLKIQIASPMLYFMVAVYTIGVMWQALSSEENAAHMQSMRMLPFEEWKFVFSYVSSLGIYVFLTKTMALFAVLLAVAAWSPADILGSVLCAVNAIFLTAAAFSLKRRWSSGEQSKRAVKRYKHDSLWRYFFRYLKAHKNYLMNMAIMYGVACILPLFLRQVEGLFAVPIGFAILSMNTPICILLSCDPSLERAVRALPGQGRRFCVPYCLFIFLCNMIADMIFLCSLQIQMGGVSLQMMATAVLIALQSAICSVLLEWFCPIRGWELECDLWHHPRKYLVPAGVLILMIVFLG